MNQKSGFWFSFVFLIYAATTLTSFRLRLVFLGVTEGIIDLIDSTEYAGTS